MENTGHSCGDGADALFLERVTGVWDGSAFTQPIEQVEIPLAPLGEVGTGHAGNIGAFLDSLDSLDSGRPAQTVASDNLLSLAMMEGAVNSATSNCSASIEAILSAEIL